MKEKLLQNFSFNFYNDSISKNKIIDKNYRNQKKRIRKYLTYSNSNEKIINKIKISNSLKNQFNNSPNLKINYYKPNIRNDKKNILKSYDIGKLNQKYMGNEEIKANANNNYLIKSINFQEKNM